MLLFILTLGKYNDQRHDDENGNRNGLMMGATINVFNQNSYNETVHMFQYMITNKAVL